MQIKVMMLLKLLHIIVIKKKTQFFIHAKIELIHRFH